MNIKEWRPHPLQEEFIKLPFSIFEGFFGGAAGPGKTETLMMLPLTYGWFKHPNFKGIILRRTFPDLEKELILRSHEYYTLTGGIYNDQKHRWKWPCGAIMQFGHAMHEKDIRNYDSAEYNFVGFDELTHFTRFQYEYLAFTRCRSSDPELPAVVRSCSNPGNIGHSWVRKRFIEPARVGRTILEQRIRDVTGKEVIIKRIFIPALATDNPTLLKNDPGYLARMEMLPEAEKKSKILGDWWLFQGQAFDEFRSEKLRDEPENAIHVVERFDIPDWYHKVYHLDWGTKSAAAGYWGALTPNKRIIIYREYNEKGKKVADWGNDFRELSSNEDIARIGLCHSAFANRGEERTLAEQFKHYAGQTPYSSGRDRKGGKYLLHDFLRWKPLERSPLNKEEFDKDIADRLLRFYGIDKFNDYCSQFKPPEPEKNLPRILIFNTCVKLIEAIPLCTIDEKDPEDVAEFDGDDPYDSLRGLLKIASQFMTDRREQEKGYEDTEKARVNLQETGNYNAFYRRMEVLESIKTVPFGVKRRRVSMRKMR